MDKTWLCHYDPETKQQSKEWRRSVSHGPKNFERKNSLKKFWPQDGILLIHYLPKGQIIDAELYSSLLVRLKAILKQTGRGNFSKDVLFLQKNAPANWSIATQKKLAFPVFHFLNHPSYSPYLAHRIKAFSLD